MAAGSHPEHDERCVPRDSIDRLIGAWVRVRPDLDFAPVGVVNRLARLRGHFDVELDAVFAEHGLSAPSFAVLVTLARLGDDQGVSQRRLMDELGLTSGTISVRIDRLVSQGLVRRAADPADKRNVQVSLTSSGRERFERAVPDHLDNERRLVSALTVAERDQLANLLRKVLVEFEGSDPPEDAQLHLGLTLAPAHVAESMRRAVGLADQPGLLVRGLEEDGPGAVAGLRAGDVLVRAGGRELRSVADLYAAIDDGAAARRIKVHAVRGVDAFTATIRLAEGSDANRGHHAGTAGRVRRDEHRL